MTMTETAASSGGEPAFYVLDRECRPVPASRGEWESFRRSGLQIVGRAWLPGGLS